MCSPIACEVTLTELDADSQKPARGRPARWRELRRRRTGGDDEEEQAGTREACPGALAPDRSRCSRAPGRTASGSSRRRRARSRPKRVAAFREANAREQATSVCGRAASSRRSSKRRKEPSRRPRERAARASRGSPSPTQAPARWRASDAARPPAKEHGADDVHAAAGPDRRLRHEDESATTDAAPSRRRSRRATGSRSCPRPGRRWTGRRPAPAARTPPTAANRTDDRARGSSSTEERVRQRKHAQGAPHQHAPRDHQREGGRQRADQPADAEQRHLGPRIIRRLPNMFRGGRTPPP